MNQSLLRRGSLAVASLACSVAAHATESRISVLGYPAASQDPMMMLAYPSLVGKAGTMALVDLGADAATHSNAAFGGTLAQERFAWGIYVSRDRSLLVSDTDPDLFAGSLAGVLATPAVVSGTDDLNLKVVDALWGMDFGGGTRMGVRLTLGGGFADDGATERDLSQFDTHVGLSVPAAPGYSVDLDGRIRFLGRFTAKTKNPDTTATLSSGLDVQLRGRIAPELTAEAPRGLYGKLNLAYATPEAELDAAQDESREFTNIFVGAEGGLAVMPLERAFVAVGLGAYYESAETPAGATALLAGNDLGAAITTMAAADADDKLVRYGVVLTGSVEAPVTETIGVLAGASYNVWGRTDFNPVGGDRQKQSLESTTDADLLSLGVFYQKDQFRFDAGARMREFLHNGPYFVTGDGTADVIGTASVSYTIL